MTHVAKAITKDEAQYILIKHLVGTAQYWANESRNPEVATKCSGVVFSSLVCLDGGCIGPPGYELRYGEDDFGGALHEHFHKYMDGEHVCEDDIPRHEFLNEMARVAKIHVNSETDSDQKCQDTLLDFLLVLDGKAGIRRPTIVPLGEESDIEYAQDEGFDYYPADGEDISGDLYTLGIAMFVGGWRKPTGLYDFGDKMQDTQFHLERM
jgi:hypothetical protein